MNKILSPIRIAIIIIWTVISATLGTLFLIVTLGNSNKALLWASQIWSPVLLFVSGVKLNVTGRENIPKEGHFIFIANHQSLFDIPVMFIAIPRPLRFIAKKELKKVPFMGWFISLIGMVFIDRKNKAKAQQSLEAAGKLIKAGKDVISFPEGTRTKDGKMKLFKRGSFIIAKSANVGLIPCAISGAYEVLPSGSSAIVPGDIHVTIGKAIYPDQHTDKTIEELAAYAKGEVEKLNT